MTPCPAPLWSSLVELLHRGLALLADDRPRLRLLAAGRTALAPLAPLAVLAPLAPALSGLLLMRPASGKCLVCFVHHHLGEGASQGGDGLAHLRRAARARRAWGGPGQGGRGGSIEAREIPSQGGDGLAHLQRASAGAEGVGGSGSGGAWGIGGGDRWAGAEAGRGLHARRGADPGRKPEFSGKNLVLQLRTRGHSRALGRPKPSTPG